MSVSLNVFVRSRLNNLVSSLVVTTKLEATPRNTILLAETEYGIAFQSALLPNVALINRTRANTDHSIQKSKMSYTATAMNAFVIPLALVTNCTLAHRSFRTAKTSARHILFSM